MIVVVFQTFRFVSCRFLSYHSYSYFHLIPIWYRSGLVGLSADCVEPIQIVSYAPGRSTPLHHDAVKNSDTYGPKRWSCLHVILFPLMVQFIKQKYGRESEDILHHSSISSLVQENVESLKVKVKTEWKIYLIYNLQMSCSNYSKSSWHFLLSLLHTLIPKMKILHSWLLKNSTLHLCVRTFLNYSLRRIFSGFYFFSFSRLVSLVMFLNNLPEGQGVVSFPQLNLGITPEKGKR